MISVFRLNHFMHHEKQVENKFPSRHDIEGWSRIFFTHISAFVLTHSDKNRAARFGTNLIVR